MPETPTPDAGVVDGAVDTATNAGANGLDTARQFAGGVVRAAVPEHVLDTIPFLMLDGAEFVMEVL